MNQPQVKLEELEDLLESIHTRYQYDFRQYARSSLRRRSEQALMRFHCKSLEELKEQVLVNPAMFSKLLSYLTVNTTELFRDPGYFKSIRTEVVPYLMTFPSIKIWIAGCSTGEEVISMAILLREVGIKRYMLYATDINPMNLERARQAIFPIDVVRKGTSAYVQGGGTRAFSDYYQAAYDGAQFDQTLLENVIFADHSLATDSVFSEMHFISCRNVLIYFEKGLQERVFRLFDESLVRDGFLGLGNKETLEFSALRGRFKVVDREYRLYQKGEA